MTYFKSSLFRKKLSVCIDEIHSSCYSPLLQDSSGLKLWKRRWFVLSNFCLFYYKGRWYFVVVHWCIFYLCLIYTCIVPYQTAEKKRLWAASLFQAIKSSSAHLENARTGSSRSRWTHLLNTVKCVIILISTHSKLIIVVIIIFSVEQ